MYKFIERIKISPTYSWLRARFNRDEIDFNQRRRKTEKRENIPGGKDEREYIPGVKKGG